MRSWFPSFLSSGGWRENRDSNGRRGGRCAKHPPGKQGPQHAPDQGDDDASRQYICVVAKYEEGGNERQPEGQRNPHQYKRCPTDVQDEWESDVPDQRPRAAGTTLWPCMPAPQARHRAEYPDNLEQNNSDAH